MPLKICFASTEVTPLAKAGGLADVSGALLKYLHADGHDVRLFMPGYSSIERAGLDVRPVDALREISVQLGTHRFDFSVSTAQLPDSSARVYLVDCPAVFSRRSIYTEDADEYLRFLVLTHATFLSCQRMVFAPQIMHFNDWHTAAGTLLLRSAYAWDRLFQSARSVLTVHNIGYQGIVPASVHAEVLHGAPLSMLDAQDYAAGRINLLKTGLACADRITTVSPTYARELRSAEYGMGMETLLRSRTDAIVGILNGVDYDAWDPRRDRYITQHYGANQLGVKAEIKDEFLQRIQLGGGQRLALLGIVSRLATQKGFDLLFESLPQLLQAREFNLVVLGTGEPRYENFFSALQRRFPARVHFERRYSDEVAHWIEAASDMFLMPSHYEPCGLNQMYSMRYGTVPIVRRTGGLADSVQHFNPSTGLGTGIVFNDYNAEAVTWALNTALDLYQNKAAWRRVMQNGMAQDYSWSRQVRGYVEMYEALVQP
jgi:starch synthase